jgi:adenosylcobinamide kinase / adenosylcobinamide-phosphate guanylyltransferase
MDEHIRRHREERGSAFLTLEEPIEIGNEVGWGIVPDNSLARAFRDMIGRLHQEIARIADQVILMVAGIPMIVRAEK